MRIREYLKDKARWILSISLFIIIEIGLLIVNNIDGKEVVYAFFVCLVSMAIMLIIDFYRWRSKNKILNKLSEEEIDISIIEQTIHDMNDVSESEKNYQLLIKKLISEQVETKNKNNSRQRDMQDYYGMWVHQIKTPIAALRLLLQEKDTDTMEEQAELFRIEQYVDLALQYIRIDSDSNDFVIERVELEPVIRASIRKYIRQFISKKIALEFESTPAKAVTDAKWLGFVLDQLISNAIKYTAKGKVKIEVIEEETQVKLVVSDTGIGIRKEDIPRICEKGYTGYNGHANQYSSGIGLYLCRQILDKLETEFEIESEENAGTRITLYLTK